MDSESVRGGIAMMLNVHWPQSLLLDLVGCGIVRARQQLTVREIAIVILHHEFGYSTSDRIPYFIENVFILVHLLPTILSWFS